MTMDASALPLPLRKIAGPLLARLNDGDLREVVQGAAMVMGIRIGGAAIALFSQVLLARWMGVYEYGIYAYVWVWVIILGILAPMGFGTSTLRFVPDYRTRQKWNRLAGILDASWRMVALFSLIAAGIGLIGLFIFKNQIADFYLWPLAVALICVPAFALTDTLEGTARAFGWVSLAYLPAYILRPLGIIIVSGIIYVVAGELSGLEAVSGALVASLVTLAGQRWFLSRRIAQTVPKAKPVRHTKYWVLSSLPLLLTEGLYLVLLNSDIVLLGMFVSPDEVGIYFAATRIVNLVTFIYFAVAALAVPKFSELFAKGDKAELQHFVHNIIQWIFWPTLAAAIVILLFGKFALGIFGAEFEGGYVLLAILVAGFVGRASTGPIEYLLNMTGNQDATAYAYFAAAALNIILNLILVPYFGLIGAAIATAIAIMMSSLWLYISVRKRLGISAFVFGFSQSHALPEPRLEQQ
ncbi:MAG: oligosaccharide flippase family protein [Parvibaculaceae bacterium]